MSRLEEAENKIRDLLDRRQKLRQEIAEILDEWDGLFSQLSDRFLQFLKSKTSCPHCGKELA